MKSVRNWKEEEQNAKFENKTKSYIFHRSVKKDDSRVEKDCKNSKDEEIDGADAKHLQITLWLYKLNDKKIRINFLI